MAKQITISYRDYLYLCMRDETLNNLEAKGVDNWDGYDSDDEWDNNEARDEYEAYIEEEEA